MEQHEKEMLEKIRQQAENIEIPENLRPEKIEEKLSKRKDRKRRRAYVSVLAAAGCAAVLGIAFLYGGIHQRKMEEEIVKRNPVIEKVQKIPDFKTAKSYEDIYEYLNHPATERNGATFNGFFETSSEEKTDSADHSRTNTRENDVDEADIVKTDGRYIYTVTEELNAVGIVDTENGKLEEITTLVLEDCDYIHEIYVQDDRLIVLYQSISKENINVQGDRNIAESMPGISENMKTAIYDISNIQNPKCLKDFMQSGFYDTSRLNGDYLYVFSQYYAHGGCKKDQYEGYIPYVDDQILPLKRISLPETNRASMHLVVTSVNIKNPDDIADVLSILSDGGECYVSAENIYMCDRKYKGRETNTAIRKISYKDGKMEGEVKTEVAGYLNDSFSIDEYKGYLRMVVSLENVETNSVYVLDENLEMTGKIQGLAKDERVYSARFMEDTAYFVTFRETDPLFSVDLSDPKNPKVIGQLKIPGFSEYLHPYGEGLLLGIGKEVDDRDVTTDEVKLSMFDISDPSNVKEIHKCIIENAYDSPAFYDYKSVTIEQEKNIIGFTAYAGHEKYYLYGYDKEKGFLCNMEEGMSGGYLASRGMYIGDLFYLVNGSRIESYSLQNFEKIDDIIL